MAEQIPYGVIVSIINTLASSIWQEYRRMHGVMDELENLNRTLESIQVVLSDAEQRQDQDPTIGHWIRRFKQVLHEADDLFDDLAIKHTRRRVNGHTHSKLVSNLRDFFSSKNPLIFCHMLARKVEKIRKKFGDVAEDMSKLKLNPSLVILKQNENDHWRETSSFVLKSDIIGREENKNEIIELLKQTNTNQNVSLIAIVGMGGLGKTALAQLVYNTAQEHKLFDKWMWVCVSDDFEVKTVVKKMLKSLNNNTLGDLEVDILQKMLQEELNGKRYMLVLDDVWNESQLKWNALRTHLMCGGEGSKVLVTTRSTMVSQIMGVNSPFVLKGLTKEQSWTLLKKLTFGEDASRMNPNLESIGERIAEKCGGVPLAIRTMGGILQTINEEEDQWLSILNGDVWRLCKEKQSIMPVLKLSYQHLPLELRQCFAYCYLYPKDWEIEKDELIHLWMAQGYLERSNKTQSMEDVGNQYIKILLMRSFFQDTSLNKYNDVISFKMHDLMHDLAKSVVENDCHLNTEPREIVERPMHISFVSSTFSSLHWLDARKLRTILCTRTRHGNVWDVNQLTIKKLKYLRILDLSYSSITELPDSIDKCKHLRYLDLSNCFRLTSLPKSIGNLVGLQSLKLSMCEKLESGAEVITKLISLRRLDIEGCKAFKSMMPLGFGQLTSLQSLSNFVVGDDENKQPAKLNELKELNNIRGRLRISNLGLVKEVELESQEANLKAKKYIQFLELCWGENTNYSEKGNKNNNSDSLGLLDNLCPHQNLRELTVSGYPGERFSGWLLSLTNIVEINLYGFSNCQYLPPLERLPRLKKVEISHFDKLEYMLYDVTSHVFFPSLEKLLLDDCKNLRGWKRSEIDVSNINVNHLLPPFEHLSYLEIWDCPNLTFMPTYQHLVELSLNSCSVRSLIETCLVQLQSFSFNPLSALKLLHIGNEVDIEALPEERMKNLTSLECLSLSRLTVIAPILQHLQHLPAKLQELKIYEVNIPDLWKDKDDIGTLCQIPHSLHSLQKMSIQCCDNLKAIPEQIRDLQSLRHLEISSCYNLKSLPEGICCLSNLQTLRIDNCPLLNDRCQIETGEDWHKIAHIPNITVE
ncbi:Virus X resistance protein-like, coiled-coil domain [Sesbania bispinosa]|nr:Virus X resistance protein-like, coiled-coil domain [Sesbania bispinosa]